MSRKPFLAANVAFALSLALPTLCFADQAAFSGVDRLSFEIATGIEDTTREFNQDSGLWLGSYISTARVEPDAFQGSDFQTRGLALGYGLGWNGISPFIGYAQGSAELDDNLHKMRIRSYFVGVSLARENGGFRYGGAVYAARTHNVISSPAALTGDADYDGKLFGASLYGGGILWRNQTGGPSVDFTLRADYTRHDTDGYHLTGIGGSEVAERTTTNTSIGAEFGMPVVMKGAAIRPYVGFTKYCGDQQDFNLSLGGTTTNFGKKDVLADHAISFGSEFDAVGDSLKGRLDVTRYAEGETSLTLNLGLRF